MNTLLILGAGTAGTMAANHLLSTLDKDAINQMVKDAEAHAEEDRQRREEAEVRNNADSLVYQTEKVLREQGGKLPDEERATVDARVSDLKSALGGSDLEAIKSATEALMTASQQFTQRLYEAAASESSGGASRSTAASDEEVVDAEIVDDGDER